MEKVSYFVQVRSDGNLVPDKMNVTEMLSRGWGPSKVIALKWEHNGQAIEYNTINSIHGIVVPGSNYVAAIVQSDVSGTRSQLIILSPDGALHGDFQNSLKNVGEDIDGCFSWFEPAIKPSADRFGIIFQAVNGNEFRCDINAQDLRVITAVRVR